jgi:membrane associated rhomboid family serine protease
VEWFLGYRATMDKEVKRIIHSFVPGLVLVGALWIVKLLEWKSGYLLTEYGVLPRTVKGITGIFTAPFIHGDYKHLISNSIPLLILGAGIFYFYNSLAYKVFVWIYLLGNFWLWLGGRESYHIGASGLVYGLTTFLFFSGVFRKETRLMALSLLVVFLYGSMVWGIFPLFVGVSWEAHLFGSIAGLLMAVVYRKDGPQRKLYEWEKPGFSDEPDDDDAFWKIPEAENVLPTPTNNKPEKAQPLQIHYIYRSDSINQQRGDEKN